MSWIVLTILFFLGSLLLTVGLVGRRRGDEPRCRQCKYNLTGLTSNECPECGATITVEGIMQGLRRKRRGMLTVASLLLLAGGAGVWAEVSGKLKTVNWYQYQPFDWVHDAAKDGKLPAVTVLHDRYDQGELSREQIDNLANSALVKQAQKSRSADLQAWIDLLGKFAAHEHLSDLQMDRFHKQLCYVELFVRPQIRQGEDLPIRLKSITRAPSKGSKYGEITVRELIVDGQRCSNPPGSYLIQMQGFNFPWSFIETPIQIPVLQPGEYRLEVELDLELFHEHPFGSDGIPDSMLTKSRTQSLVPQILRKDVPAIVSEDELEQSLDPEHADVRQLDFGDRFNILEEGGDDPKPFNEPGLSLSHKFEVLPPDAPDTVQTTSDSSLTDFLNQAISLTSAILWTNPRNGGKPYVLMPDSKLGGSSPIDMAFEVFAVIEGKEYSGHLMGQDSAITVAKDNRWGYDPMIGVDDFDAKEITIILRSSVDIARKTVDLKNIWAGELVFEHVKVRRLISDEDESP